MPTAKLTREQALDRITEVFRSHGYDGTTLRLISEATGLGRASLYHHFPGGKDEMAAAVFDHIGARVQRHVIDPLGGDGSPAQKIARHVKGVSRLYEGGDRNCLWGAMVLGGGLERFPDRIQGSLKSWIAAVAAVLREAGIPAAEARRRSEIAHIQIQGALIVSRGSGSTAPFKRVLRELPIVLFDGS